ncbi:MAG: hypothetical protein GWN67_25810 [Phycisphaerae bacterium]|nr:hypothetical protein [Phycisphaerae bacterium]NIP55521.1 hypothetical protein [Phycisphaerae bacterium]NIS54217.1 hypothetical protein [Phycisphaerae bacterium]NIU11829.1 hypothetical protein [Phycisphaerae bacterium]NIU59676.1 hypothetical protein [Phycisphaerae bacterium]
MTEMRISKLLRQITAWIVICCLVMAGFAVNTALSLDGSGTQEDPWRIRSLADFNDFAADPNYWDDYIRLETDVNLAGRVYDRAVIAPILPYGGNNDFSGVFDGNHHKIINLHIDDGGTENDFLGLFGFVVDGEVRNLGLEGVSVSGDMFVGGLMGKNFGLISNCYSTGGVNGVSLVGGLVGNNGFGNISNCYSTCDVNGVSTVGGLVGLNSSGNISNCYSIGDVSGVEYVGGVVGLNSAGNISNCFWDTDTQTHRVTESIGLNEGTVTNVHGLPTYQLHQQSIFQVWDFINVWNIGENQTYPYLRTYLAGDINKDGIVNFKDFAFVALQWLEECNFGNCPPRVLITYPEDGARLMVGGVPPQTLIWAEANDYDGMVVGVEFFVDDLKLGEDTDGSDGWNYLWQNYSLGFHVLTATAWDNQGLSGMSTPVNVEVWMPDPPPP